MDELECAGFVIHGQLACVRLCEYCHVVGGGCRDRLRHRGVRRGVGSVLEDALLLDTVVDGGGRRGPKDPVVLEVGGSGGDELTGNSVSDQKQSREKTASQCRVESVML